ASDLGTGSGGVLNDGVCNGTEACVYIDKITAIYWAPKTSIDYTWENGITYCENLVFGTYSDWRMPTQKEMNQFFIDNGYSLKSSTTQLNVTFSQYWSSTTASNNSANAWGVEPLLFNSDASKASTTRPILCMRAN
ncbi:MAG: DUF1566 domain-containing protein, partial [Proteobacteria bacterium]